MRNNLPFNRFTLIELLVVVAIIGILMTLLLPALRNAKIHAKRVICQGNLKQIHLGATQYADDYDGQLPYYDSPNWDASYYTDADRIWINGQYKTGWAIFRNLKYVDKGLLSCPEMDAKVNPSTNRGRVDYGFRYNSIRSIDYAEGYHHSIPVCVEALNKVRINSPRYARKVFFTDGTNYRGSWTAPYAKTINWQKVRWSHWIGGYLVTGSGTVYWVKNVNGFPTYVYRYTDKVVP